jgi:hypothetical protein
MLFRRCLVVVPITLLLVFLLLHVILSILALDLVLLLLDGQTKTDCRGNAIVENKVNDDSSNISTNSTENIPPFPRFSLAHVSLYILLQRCSQLVSVCRAKLAAANITMHALCFLVTTLSQAIFQGLQSLLNMAPLGIQLCIVSYNALKELELGVLTTLTPIWPKRIYLAATSL